MLNLVRATGPRAARLRFVIAIAVGAVVTWMLVAAGTVLAASPDPTTGPAAGDPRSAGQGPGLVGDPMLAIGLVILIAAASVVLTLAYVRLTAD